MTDCECSAGGWCARHRCQKTDHLTALCRQSPEYFALWEAGKGPCIHGGPDSVAAGEEPPRGLGDSLARIAAWLGFKKAPGCGCEKRQELLNRLFPY